MVLVIYGKDLFKDERDGTIRNFDEIDPKEGFADAQADFTELAELNDPDANGRPIPPKIQPSNNKKGSFD